MLSQEDHFILSKTISGIQEQVKNNQKTWARSHIRCCGQRRLVLCRYDITKGRLLKCEECGDVKWENGEEWE